jgi:D-glycero-alpha-D-manno-heptose-7-phosphate kinase
MIGVQTPFRVSFAGGGTDLPLFYKKHGGKVISTSIDKYMFHFIHKFHDSQIQIKYSITENIDDASKIKHPIVREASKYYNLRGLDINSIADIPKGTGLGSSSAYTVGLINGLNANLNKNISKSKIAAISSDLEINKLNDPIGKQDHYASAFGGLNLITFYKDERVSVKGIKLNQDALKYLNSSMVLVKYGESRSASKILKEQNSNLSNQKYMNITSQIYSLVDEMYKALINSEIKLIGEILTENWNLKKKLSKNISNRNLDLRFLDLINTKGIYGGKLLGAGNSGYILLVGEPKKIASFADPNLLKFKFENEGTKIIFNYNS